MTIKELEKLCINNKDIEFEDYDGNTIFMLKDLDLADIEEGNVVRLQRNIKDCPNCGSSDFDGYCPWCKHKE